MKDQSVYKDIRVYRFRAPLLKRGDLQDIELRADGPVPIFSDSDKLLGFATLSDKKSYALVEAALDPANPERLDLETNATAYWLDAVVEYRGNLSARGFKPSLAHVKALVLTTDKVPGQEPIDTQLGGLL